MIRVLNNILITWSTPSQTGVGKHPESATLLGDNVADNAVHRQRLRLIQFSGMATTSSKNDNVIFNRLLQPAIAEKILILAGQCQTKR